VQLARATADLFGGMSVRSAAGLSARRRRRGPEGLRSAGGARRVTVPDDGDQEADCSPPRRRSAARRVALPPSASAPARRVPRALETVEKVVTGTNDDLCPAPLDVRHSGFT
jgi:hypothetical protein